MIAPRAQSDTLPRMDLPEHSFDYRRTHVDTARISHSPLQRAPMDLDVSAGDAVAVGDEGCLGLGQMKSFLHSQRPAGLLSDRNGLEPAPVAGACISQA